MDGMSLYEINTKYRNNYGMSKDCSKTILEYLKNNKNTAKVFLTL